MLIFLFVHVACGATFDSTQFAVSERRARVVSHVRGVLTTGGCCFCQAFRKLLDGFGCPASSTTCTSPLKGYASTTDCPTSGTQINCNGAGKIQYINLSGAAVQGTVLNAAPAFFDFAWRFFFRGCFFNQGAHHAQIATEIGVLTSLTRLWVSNHLQTGALCVCMCMYVCARTTRNP